MNQTQARRRTLTVPAGRHRPQRRMGRRAGVWPAPAACPPLMSGCRCHWSRTTPAGCPVLLCLTLGKSRGPARPMPALPSSGPGESADRRSRSCPQHDTGSATLLRAAPLALSPAHRRGQPRSPGQRLSDGVSRRPPSPRARRRRG